MKPSLCVLTACLLLSACQTPAPPPDSGIQPPASWAFAANAAAQRSDIRWWQQFGSPQLNRLIEQASLDSHEVAAAMARVRQAQASAIIGGAPLLPELAFDLRGERNRFLRNSDRKANPSDDNNTNNFTSDLTASYEVDFWGGIAAGRDSALQGLRASQFDQATVELTLLANVADRYAQTLAAREQGRIAELNLANAQDVLRLVQTRYESGSATALELAQQKNLVAAQQRELPRVQQLANEQLITLAALLGQPVQNLHLADQPFDTLNWPDIGPGLPSELLTRRPDLAKAEADLAAAQANVTVARAAMLPKLTLSARLGTENTRAEDWLRAPFSSLAAGLIGPIFNNGRLAAERDKATARQEELLETYRGAIINSFADVEKALNSMRGQDQQRYWHEEELKQAQTAFRIAQSRYQEGAEVLLTVLETQRTLYQAQDVSVQLRLARVQASIALYKALGGGWQVR
ncbi:efflux transporter outer membrane subunit [Pseudomonas syringae]|uniref:Efflux transporter outer membrane subunit n=1 Tax=Pseudomonas syringae pv. papulans TaxID=83963 RepID=A0AA43IUR0_PSESX|nr:efflux transporter outer membrane subunit [Pseudomonas syringae]KPY36123.1 RND efflux system, outer membrane lipoprotein, NodT [Pseudomonas syringae pv. papulans]KWS36111.1 RND transporter [Pseudomonas syringae pv. papulans]MDH4601876.1 efflux transporter outer membrane subunit [Pseudomonas syringae pv. papulans]MDH4623657.1 efflux transporter outer membrane subunit [Pseudomonas syringae pv. papulans]RMN77952.1 RND efflux system, outer membrane lipoprotein [Pseudomonas syringae pv. papulans